MKKMIFTLMLAIVSCVWMMSKACLSSITTDQAGPYIVQTGILGHAGSPCFEGEDCPTCLALVLITNDRTYYPTTDNEQLRAQLEELYYYQGPISLSGVVFEREDYHFIQVNNIDTTPAPLRLNSLCDTWNVLEVDGVTCGGCEVYRTMKYCLTTDTIIGSTHYVKLMKGNAYEGALREGNNRDIYFIPSGSTHEYLLYAFNAQIGDELTDLWLGRTTNEVFTKEYFPYGVNATVEEITETSPRRFVLSTGYITTEEGVENYPYYFEWIEGIGFASAPDGADYPLPYAGGFTSFLLCAYKNGEQIYVSEMGAEYGCEHDQTPEPTDTIPLYSYTGDDPGSSTVDPVDPNQVVATLQGDQLTIHENMGVDITYSLQNNAPAQTPAQHRAPQNDTFRNEVTVQITESGEYLLQLTNPSWGYTIFGRFNYSPQGIEITKDQSSIINKVIRDGRLLILRGDKTYTVTGQEVR